MAEAPFSDKKRYVKKDMQIRKAGCSCQSAPVSVNNGMLWWNDSRKRPFTNVKNRK